MSQKYKTGLVIGKFYPFHKGHEYLINMALKRVKKLWVMVCQTDRYLIPVEKRAGWIKEIFPQVNIKIIRHEPRLDSVSTKISKEWADIVLNLLGEAPGVVFSSEKYGQAFAKHMGSIHVMVDIDRNKFPISGTKIRENPLRYWKYLPDPVKEYYAKRVVILGAESTGTTTLATDLAKHYKTIWVPEYGRTYYEGRMYAPNINEWTSDEFLHIAKLQNAMENSLSRKSNGLVICDTDSWATGIWHKRYVGNWCRELDAMAKNDKVLYILTDVDIPFVQDGTRDGEHIRKWMHSLFLKKLKSQHKNYIVVSGGKKERLQKAIKAINRL